MTWRLWLHAGRVAVWIAQLPLVFWLVPSLKKSLAYIIFLSIAALIESAGTDLDQALTTRKQESRYADDETDPGDRS